MFATSHHPLPPITLGMSDYVRLMREVWRPGAKPSGYARSLLLELSRAHIAPPAELPEGIVSLNSRVTYRVDEEPNPRTHLLVHPDELRWPGAEIAATTPLGIALLGLREGDAMQFMSECGERQHRVEVLRVGLRFPDFGLLPIGK